MASTVGVVTTPFLSMGRDTFQIPMDALFGANRRKLVSHLMAQAISEDGEEDGQQLSLHDNNNNNETSKSQQQRQKNKTAVTVVYLVGGPSMTRFDSDHEPIFRQESYFWYLTGVKEPDCAMAICIHGEGNEHTTTLFIPRLPRDYATVMGHIATPDEWKELYQVDHVYYMDEAEMQLESMLLMLQDPSDHQNAKLLLLQGPNSDSGKLYEAPSIQSPKLQSLIDVTTLFPILAECRVIKSPTELALLQHVTELTSWAHAYVMRNIRPNQMEYQAESLFRHYCYYNYGCRLVGYTPICGCGPDAAILHYGHAGEPNARPLHDGDMFLSDMGAEYHCYGSDVTCSYPVNGRFTQSQVAIYNGVLNAQRAVYQRIRPGVSWVDCHKAAEAALLEMLLQEGIVILPTSTATTSDSISATKTIEELVEMRLGAVFMPHGLGHFIGIDTHDVGGYLPSNPPRILLPGLRSLRTARILQTGMVLTVEPGCYFIDHLMDEALQDDSPLRPYLNATKLREYRGWGGVRLEDVVTVTDDGFVNLTLCPRTVSEVEHVMNGGKWPPIHDEAPELGRVRLTNLNKPLLPSPSPPSL